MPETMKLFRSTKSKITKDKNDENGSHLGNKPVKVIINKIKESCINLFLINSLVTYYIFHPQKIILLKIFDSELS